MTNACNAFKFKNRPWLFFKNRFLCHTLFQFYKQNCLRLLSYSPSRLVQVTSLLFESNALLCNQQGRQCNTDFCKKYFRGWALKNLIFAGINFRGYNALLFLSSPPQSSFAPPPNYMIRKSFHAHLLIGTLNL